jgi:dTDP-4-amino-4,6-dideoxygalactose transaminase
MALQPFNRPPIAGSELDYLKEVIEARSFSGNGTFTERCHRALGTMLGGAGEVLLTQSCTAALEMAAMLADLGPGDEAIMPSFTFVSTANAVVLRGASPVFVDIRPDTLNIDEELIEAAITPRTKAIFVVHYAGVCAEMDAINAIAARHSLVVVEDAAQAHLSTYRGVPAGRLSTLACFSFHETKNITAGEGGALVVNDSRLVSRAYVLWEKGTNRRAFHQGIVDKYTWVDVGSSFLPSEFTAAVLLAQIEKIEEITARRMVIWQRYFDGFAHLEARGVARLPIVPAHCRHNAHIFYLLMHDGSARDRLLKHLMKEGIYAPFHYVPLHSSPAGQRFAHTCGTMDVTNAASAKLIRMPIYSDMALEAADGIIDRVIDFLSNESAPVASTA